MGGGRIGGRFEIEREAGAGGMGTVYRALDAETGAPVALKLLQRCGADELERLAREARSIADLSHPGVVRYVAHGASGEGPSFLAMEWLDGEDLAERLGRSGLSMGEAIGLGRRIAEALAAVHARGIVHRDLKPSNLFLPGGSIERVKIIDFGIARIDLSTRALTRTGIGLGTPGYMAPEQARGAREVDARADLFSLGCILFECLTGRPAFTGEHPIAVLAKVLFEEAPRVLDLRPSAPEPLSALIARMLEKDPALRPESASAVAASLASIEPLARLDETSPFRLSAASLLTETASVSSLGLGADKARPLSSARSAITRGEEQRLISVIVVGAPDIAAAPAPEGTATLPTMAALWPAEGALRLIAAEHGADVARLLNGTAILSIAGVGAATDRAARAARCALAVRAAAPQRSVVLATGRGSVDRRASMGDVIDRAADLLATAPDRADAGVRLDELTAGLLDARFQVRWEPDLFMLFGERDAEDAPRTLLGQPTTCVGRERELRTLLDLHAESAEEPRALAVLVMAGPGVGKSRLRQELMGRVRAQGKPVSVWLARGDPMRSGAPFGLLNQVLRREAKLEDGEPAAHRRRKIAALAARRVAEADRARVAEFLGEMVGAHFPDEGREQLRAARRDPILMGDQMRRAWVDFVQAECRSRPVILILEDLHWGDQPTVDYVDAALRLLGDAPLLVVALARPEVAELFPKLWVNRGVQTIRLGALSRRASERLVREVLGDEVSDELVARICERSAGNAFFLEELLRAEAEGRSEGAPDTVLAMLQSRLEGLPAELRRILRAGSVLGEVLWNGAVATLLGEQPTSASLANWFTSLESAELLMRRSEPRFRGEVEYAFRHTFVRDAAYKMLSDKDRVASHRLAGEWLSLAGEEDAAVVAAHFERGDSKSRAIGWYCRAAEQALEGNDLEAVIGHAARAEACGAAGGELGYARLLAATAHNWRGDFAAGERCARASMGLLRPGSARWYDAAERLAWAVEMAGNVGQIEELIEMLSPPSPEPDATGSWLVAWVAMGEKLLAFNQRDRAEEVLEKVDGWVRRSEIKFGPVLGRLRFLRAHLALHDGRAVDSLRNMIAAIEHNEEAGDLRNACLQRINLGLSHVELGAFSDAEKMLRGSLGDADRMGMGIVAAMARLFLALSLAALGELREARDLAEEAARYFGSTSTHLHAGYALVTHARVLMAEGDLDAAESVARRAMEIGREHPAPHTYALAALALILLKKGATAEALSVAREANGSVEKGMGMPAGKAFVWLVYAEALHAAGRMDEARAILETARDRVLRMAPDESEPMWRASYLENVRENARILELSRAWLNE